MRRAAFALALTLLLVSAVVADDFKLQTGSMVPAAVGVVKVDHDDNGNAVVTLSAKHLAAPDSLTPPKSHYVVWIQPRDQQPQIAGMMSVDPKKAEASFRTTTPFKNFDVLVTAEDNPRPDTPSDVQIFKGTIAGK